MLGVSAQQLHTLSKFTEIRCLGKFSLSDILKEFLKCLEQIHLVICSDLLV